MPMKQEDLVRRSYTLYVEARDDAEADAFQRALDEAVDRVIEATEATPGKGCGLWVEAIMLRDGAPYPPTFWPDLDWQASGLPPTPEEEAKSDAEYEAWLANRPADWVERSPLMHAIREAQQHMQQAMLREIDGKKEPEGQ
jgi:hypothetical protein